MALPSVSDGWKEMPSDSTSVVSRVLPSLFPFVDDLLLHLPYRIGDGTFGILNNCFGGCFFGQLISGFISLYANVGSHPAQTNVVVVISEQVSYLHSELVATSSILDGLE